MTPGRLSAIATLSLVLLILLCLAWELWLAPLRPGGSWLVLKVLPLLAPLRGVLHGRRYTYQWSSMLILGYFAEGVVRAITESGTGSGLGAVEAALSATFFLSAIFYARAGRIARPDQSPG